ncbi:5-formyltetrahydrofolate cyclo-ligase [Paenibacillus swuensis]|uniref:5-formyltetrahydrofolate cyclo-ligase n=1 Tax=Paenibacillus swuensis TaxID=1178515 RepID=UPI0018D2F284|nr:5-formyltetrahydrofolate cyclo-ligase [Paenibacillus swuensis]
MKKLLRAEVIRQRAELTSQEHAEKSKAACIHAQHLLTSYFKSGSTLLTYIPFGTEIDVTPLMDWWRKRGGNIAVPKVDMAKRSMMFYIINKSDDLVQGAYGILEPREGLELYEAWEEAVALIVPGSAFDRNGGRLGMGGGYYDRFLQKVVGSTNSPVRIGIAFQCQLVDQIPMEPHDFDVQQLVTEQGTLDCISKT